MDDPRAIFLIGFLLGAVVFAVVGSMNGLLRLKILVL